MPRNEDDAPFRGPLRRAFVVWSWIGLLGAYIATSTSFSSQLQASMSGGFRVFDIRLPLSVLCVLFILPTTSMVLAWLVFYRYSVTLYGWVFADRFDDPPALLVQFRLALLYLVLTWIFVLIAGALPFISTMLLR